MLRQGPGTLPRGVSESLGNAALLLAIILGAFDVDLADGQPGQGAQASLQNLSLQGSRPDLRPGPLSHSTYMY